MSSLWIGDLKLNRNIVIFLKIWGLYKKLRIELDVYCYFCYIYSDLGLYSAASSVTLMDGMTIWWDWYMKRLKTTQIIMFSKSPRKMIEHSHNLYWVWVLLIDDDSMSYPFHHWHLKRMSWSDKITPTKWSRWKRKFIRLVRLKAQAFA